MRVPLNLDSVRISSTANGFLVYAKGPDRVSTESDMYSFESLSSMIAWLQINLKNNGSKPIISPPGIFGNNGAVIVPANLPPIHPPINEN